MIAAAILSILPLSFLQENGDGQRQQHRRVNALRAPSGRADPHDLVKNQRPKMRRGHV
jgi:hypothetical protein